MALFGLVGYPLGHSFSKMYFEEKFRREALPHRFELFPISSIELLPQLAKQHPDLKGLAVTIPYKQSVMAYLQKTDPRAKAVGAVNCISTGAEWKGYNTDIIGFEQSLQPLLREDITSALVLGSGGAAAAVRYVLQQKGIHCILISRKKMPGYKTYEEISPELMQQCLLVVNCTPLGMYPDTSGFPPLPYHAISPRHVVYDLVYNPANTRLMQLAQEQGAITQNGLDMLYLQAEANWAIWNRVL